MASEDAPLVFASETPRPAAPASTSNWKILIADDEPNVHLVTQLALGGFQFMDRGLELLNAYNEADVKRMLAEHTDIALILLDVVMDSLHSGFDLVRHIREDLGNKNVRIILRTGQSGHAPEDKVIIDYDINDFKDKTELTVAKLRTAIISSLRSYWNQVLLDQSLEYLQHVIDQTSSCFITVDARLNVKLWNQAAERLFGVSRHDAVGKSLYDIHPLFHSIEFLIQDSFQSETTSEHRRVPFQEKGNHLIDLTLTPMKNQSVKEILLRIDDVTKVKRKEEQISFIEKVHAIGNIRRIWSDYLSESKTEMAGLLKSLEDLPIDQLRRGLSNIYQRLQNTPFTSVEKASQKSTKFRPIPLETFLDGILKTLEHPTEVSVVFDNRETNATILGEHILLGDALHSFLKQIINLNDPPKQIALSIDKKYFSDDMGKLLGPVREKSYLCLEISLSPPKIPGIQDDSFEILSEDPVLQNFYFSFGNLYQIVLDHRGFLEMESDEGMITAIKIYLPEESGHQVSSPVGRLGFAKGSGTIVVCDDDGLTRQVTASILGQAGFDVLTARNGNDALDILRKNKDVCRLVVLDLLLPGIEGSQVYEQIRDLAPKIPVLFSSGFGKNEKVQEALRGEQVGFLQKPFTMEQLLEKVFDILGENQSGYR